MPDILSTLLGGAGNQGLLSPEQQGDVTGQGLMSMGAAMLKAAGPSPYKHTTLSGLGEGIQGLVSGRNTAMNSALNQQLVRSKMLESALPLLKMERDAYESGEPLTPGVQRTLDALKSVLGTGGSGPSGVGTGVPGTALPPPANVLQKFAVEHGFPRSAIRADGPGHAEFQKAFEEAHAGDTGFAAQEELKKVNEKEVESYDKKYNGINALGQISTGIHDVMGLGKSLANSPGFFSGAGSDWVTNWRRLLVLAGRDPNTPLGSSSNEIFKKVFSEALAKRVEELGAAKESYGEAGAARPLLAQLDIMKNASPNTDMASPAMKTLMEQIDREALRNVKITHAAIDHAVNSPRKRLDKEWDRKHLQMLSEPTFTPEELGGIQGGVGLPGNPPYPTTAAPAAPAGASTGPAPVPGAIGPLGQGGNAPSAPTKMRIDPKTGAKWGLVNNQWVPLGK